MKIMDCNESIKYPIDIYGDFKHAIKVSVDIGGTLIKISYLVKCKNINNEEYKYNLRFIKFESKYIENCLDFLQKHIINTQQLSMNIIYGTGGGSQKYKDLIEKKLGIKIIVENEMDCIVKGSTFLIENVKNETFKIEQEDFPSLKYKKIITHCEYPFLLVNIGSGVSIIKVESPEIYERIGGTAIGGGTFWGLGSLLTQAETYDDLISMACEGNADNIDMLVKDIYGLNFELLKLPPNLTASYFGKCYKSIYDKNLYNIDYFNKNDIARSLLQMITVNISHISVLYAQIHKLKNIYFSGCFLTNNIIPILGLSKAISYFSNNTIISIFFKHVGYLGCLGAFHSGCIKEKRHKNILSSNIIEGIYEENIAETSCDNYIVTSDTIHPLKIISFDLNQMFFCKFPLLISGGGMVIELTIIKDVIEYLYKWVDIFIKQFKYYHESKIDNLNSICEQFETKIKLRLNCYKSYNYIKLLNNCEDIWYIPERFIKQFLLIDPLLSYKHEMNQLALNEGIEYYQNLNLQTNIHERFSEIFHYLYAGNLIDFSSNEFLTWKLDNNHKQMNLQQLLTLLPNFSLINNIDFNKFIEYFTIKKWKNILIFVDKSGYDFIFGIYGIVREFLNIGSKVILAANSLPFLTDVVYSEMSLIFDRIKHLCPIFKNLLDDSLKFAETGFGSPYLNLYSINSNLCQLVQNVDLIIIDGLSRCIINRLEAKFSCDVLYIGTVSSTILSSIYQLQLYDTFFKLDLS